MKKGLVLLLGVFGICACAKTSTNEIPAPSGNAAIIFNIGFSDDVKAQTTAERTINRLQVGLYNNAGVLEWENTYEYAFTTVKTVSGLTEGQKTIVAVANKEITMPATLEEFYSIPVSLEENRRDAFVMFGSESTEAAVSPAITTIRMQRAVAKITVRASLSKSFNDGKTHEFIPERIYLSNVAVKTNLRGDAFSEFINLRESLDQTDNATLRDFTVADKNYWVSGDVFNHGVDFYVCPNKSAERKTALIIKATFDGATCYYPLIVSDEILYNTMYRCGAITITCEGMPNPSDDFTSIRIRFIYESDDWKTGETAEKVVFE